MPVTIFSTFLTQLRVRQIAGALLAVLLLPAAGGASALSDRLGISLFDAREKAPEIEAPDLSGHMLRLSDYRGKVILLNFWATWCEPCKKEIPSLLALKKKLPGRSFAILSVAMDRRISHIPPFVQKLGIDYPVMEGRKGKVDSRYFGLGLPQSYVILPDGTLVGRVMGGRVWDSSEFVDYFESLIGKPRSAPIARNEKGNL